MDLATKYRPKLLKNVVGQQTAVQQLKGLLESKRGLPQNLLFTGPSGCGKTTLARISAKKVGCGSADFKEINAAESRGIDTIRKIDNQMRLKPLGGKSRVWLIDEAHRLTGEAQDAMLKILEEPPAGVYFMLATTVPEKLVRTIITRCTEIRVKGITSQVLGEHLASIATAEGMEPFSDEVMEALLEASEGSARQALVLLNSIADIESEEDRLELLASAGAKSQAIDLVKLLLFSKPKWPAIAKLLKTLDEDAERVRRAMLAYATSVMLGNLKMAPRCALILDRFREHFYDCGKAGLAVACWEVVCDARQT